MTLHETMHRWLLGDVLATRRGRVHVLTQAAEEASGGEPRLFEALAARMEDAELRRVVERQRGDERRHAQLFAECAARQGEHAPAAPRALGLVDAVDRHVGVARGTSRFLDDLAAGDRGGMEGALFLQVLVERGLEQLRALAAALRPFDERSAGIAREVEAAERRHLGECRAVARRHAPHGDMLAATLEQFRRAEALAYREHAAMNLRFLAAEGLLPSAASALFWRGVGAAAPYAELPWTDAVREGRQAA